MSIIIRDNSAVMDCSSTHIGITNDLNDWNQPTNSETFSYTESCSATNFTISFTDIEAGYRPFMDSFLTATANARFNVDYIYKYTCKMVTRLIKLIVEFMLLISTVILIVMGLF